MQNDLCLTGNKRLLVDESLSVFCLDILSVLNTPLPVLDDGVSQAFSNRAPFTLDDETDYICENAKERRV